MKTLKEVITAKLKKTQQTDDKTMIMERVIQLVSNLPTSSRLRVKLTNTFLNELWYSLEHPPALYVGDKYKYRMADGSYNVRLRCFHAHILDTSRLMSLIRNP